MKEKLHYISKRVLHKFTHEIRLTFAFALLLIFVFNVTNDSDSFSKLKLNLQNENKEIYKQQLTSIFLENNQFEKAEKEVKSKELLEEIQKKKMAKKDIQKEINKMIIMSFNYPYYRDLHTALAINYFRLNEYLEAKKQIEISLSIDPNNKYTKIVFQTIN